MENVREIVREGKRLAEEDPRRVVHSLKVGLVLALVSSFYYYQPLYNSFGVNAMWAVMTVVVSLPCPCSFSLLFKSNIGATLGKGFNRVAATLLPGALGLGAHHLASMSGSTGEPILLAIFVFIQDFGDKYCEALEEDDGTNEFDKLKKDFDNYKSVLNSKSNEESLTNFAKWEPGHGKFRFQHPWKQYLAVGELIRQCAYPIYALNSHLMTDTQVPIDIKKKLGEALRRMSSESGKAMKEMSNSLKKMTKPSFCDIHVQNAQSASKSLTTLLKSGILKEVEPLELIALVTTISLLIDIINLTEKILESVHELASAAKFINKIEPPLISDKPNAKSVVCVRPTKCHDQHVVTIIENDDDTSKIDNRSNEVSIHEKHEDGHIHVHSRCVSCGRTSLCEKINI